MNSYKNSILRHMPSKYDVYSFPSIRHSKFTTRVVSELARHFPGHLVQAREHQELVRQQFRTTHGLLVVHGVGTGKTITASLVAKDFLATTKQGLVILVTPPGVLGQFYAQLGTVVPPRDMPRVFPMGLQTLDGELKKQFRGSLKDVARKNKVLLIVDEAHYINNQKSAMTRRVFELATLANKVLLMTATPITNKNSEFGTLLAFVTQNPAMLGVDLTNVDDARFTHAAKCKVSVYMNDTETNSNFPAMIEHPPINIQLDEKTYWNAVISNSLNTKIQYAHERTKLAQTPYKFDILMNILRTHPGKSIVYVEMKSVVQTLQKVLAKHSVPYSMIVGSTPSKTRRDLVTKFSSSPIGTEVMIISKAGMVGLDFKRVSNVIFLELPWNYSDYQQIVGRAVRYKSHVNAVHKEVHIFTPLFKAPPNAPRQLFNRAAFDAIQKKKLKMLNFMTRIIEASIEKNQCVSSDRRITRAFTALTTRRRKAAPHTDNFDPRGTKLVRFANNTIRKNTRKSIRNWLIKTWPRLGGKPVNNSTNTKKTRKPLLRTTSMQSIAAPPPRIPRRPNLERASAPSVMIGDGVHYKTAGNKSSKYATSSSRRLPPPPKTHTMVTRRNSRYGV